MTSFEENQEHEICELICLKCLNRWIGVFPTETLLKNIECKCGEVGYVIKTGQSLEEVADEDMLNDIRYQNMVTMWGKKIAQRKYREFIKGE